MAAFDQLNLNALNLVKRKENRKEKIILNAENEVSSLERKENRINKNNKLSVKNTTQRETNKIRTY